MLLDVESYFSLQRHVTVEKNESAFLGCTIKHMAYFLQTVGSETKNARLPECRSCSDCCWLRESLA